VYANRTVNAANRGTLGHRSAGIKPTDARTALRGLAAHLPGVNLLPGKAGVSDMRDALLQRSAGA
jgi:hypothetical protein